MTEERYCRCGRIVPASGTAGYCLPCYSRHVKAGLTRRVPVTAVQERLRELHRHGWSLSAIARETGTSPANLRRIRDGGQTPGGREISVWRQTAAKIMLVPLVDQPEKQVATLGAQRRIRALMCLGWAVREIAEAAEVSEATLKRINNDGCEYIELATFARIKGAYDRMSMRTPEPSASVYKIKHYATKVKMWHPPLAWDDDDDYCSIDDPEAVPYDTAERERKRIEKYQRDRERMQGIFRLVDGGPAREHIAKLRALGWQIKAIAAAADVPDETVRCIVHRNTRVKRERAEQILALPLIECADNRLVVDTAEARKHIDKLRELGWKFVAIGEEVGIPEYAVRNIYSRARSANRERVEAVLGIPLKPPPTREVRCTPGARCFRHRQNPASTFCQAANGRR